jgi:hypothetical protein
MVTMDDDESTALECRKQRCQGGVEARQRSLIRIAAEPPRIEAMGNMTRQVQLPQVNECEPGLGKLGCQEVAYLISPGRV